MPVTPKPIRVRCWLIFAGAWIATLFALAPLDLPLSTSVNDPHSPWANWIAGYGTLPSTILYIVAALLVAASAPRRSPLRNAPVVGQASITLLLAGLLQPFAITGVMKAAFGRPRFFQLEGRTELYSHFFQFNDVLQGSSFPSGHVATAVVGFPVAWVLWRLGHRKLSIAVAAVTATWGIITAAGRIVAGAHFLTDTFFSFGLALALCPLVGQAALSLHRILFRKPDVVDGH